MVNPWFFMWNTLFVGIDTMDAFHPTTRAQTFETGLNGTGISLEILRKPAEVLNLQNAKHLIENLR